MPVCANWHWSQKKGFDVVWGELFKNLKYKFHIDLKARKKKTYESHISTVRKNEWGTVIQTFSALCEEYGQSPSEMIDSTI